MKLIFYQFLSFCYFLFVLASLLINRHINAQCQAVGGSSGTVQNTTRNRNINFSVTISPTCSFVNLGSFAGACGISFPSINAPWSGNTDGSTSTITYSFSVPITSVDVLIGYTGINGKIIPETFIFTTNGLTPTLSVNSGTCMAWNIVGNQSTSPSITDGLNSIHRVSSDSAFTSLTITTNSSGNGSTGNGGSSFAICDASLIPCITSIDLGNDTTLCIGKTLTLDAATANATYLWQDNSTSPSFNVTQPGSYWVEVTVNNCSTTDRILTDTILTEEKDCDIILEMPNVFTPNEDGINDLFVPIISKGIVSMNTTIVNRWGKKIYETDNLLIEWNGQDTSDGTYFWMVYYTDLNGLENNLKGHVTILK